MIDKEKVLHGLDSCGFHDGIPNICEVTECPYRDNKAYCVHELAHDAGMLISELLKAQEPRVLTLAEVTKCSMCWLEDDVMLVPALFIGMERRANGTKSDVFLANVQDSDDCEFWYDLDDYGVTWRCWTSRPTDEQREAEPWQE